jgi:hypothetical protein
MANSTAITFRLTQESHVVLYITDVRGNIIRKLVDNTLKAGRHEVTVSLGNFVSGTYFYFLESNGDRLSQEMHLIQ